MAWIGAVIGGVASLAGGLMANESRSDEAQSNREFQESMSNTSYSRAVADLKAAGINPMLVSKVGGASTPAGNVAEVQDAVTPALSSAAAAYKVAAELDQIKANSELARANAAAAESQKAKLDSETAINAVMIPKIEAETQSVTANTGFMNEQTKLSQRNQEKVMAELDQIATQMNLTSEQVEKVRAETMSALKYGKLLDEQTKTAKLNSVARALNNSLLELELPRAANESEAQGSWWMRNISPYLPDVLKSTSSAVRIQNMFKE